MALQVPVNPSEFGGRKKIVLPNKQKITQRQKLLQSTGCNLQVQTFCCDSKQITSVMISSPHLILHCHLVVPQTFRTGGMDRFFHCIHSEILSPTGLACPTHRSRPEGLQALCIHNFEFFLLRKGSPNFISLRPHKTTTELNPHYNSYANNIIKLC